MNPVRSLARPLLASVFVSGGVDMLRNASSLAPVAAPVTSKVIDAAQPVVDRATDAAAPAVEAAAEKVVDLAEQAGEALPDAAQPATDAVRDQARPLTAADPTPPQVDLPRDPELLTQVNGAVMVGAGLLLAVGKLPRLSAAALAATLVPTTLAAHRFWEVDDPDEKQAQQIHFFKNLALVGGLALASQDTAGKPSVAWRAGNAGRTAKREAKLARRVATAEAGRRVADVRTSVADVLPG